jgi:hypothetical protein
MRYDVLIESDDRPHHFATVDADDADAARRLVAEKWPEAELRLRIVRVDGDRVTTLTDNTEGGGNGQSARSGRWVE